MRTMCLTTWLVVLAGLILALQSPAHAAPPAAATDNPRDQVAAASRQAVEMLRAQIGNESIGQGLTVNDLLKKTGSAKTFAKTICRAHQIGGPRWIDQTCQVRLEISGGVVARRLVEIAQLNHLESPVQADVLQNRLRNWDNRTFSATGTSAAPGVAAQAQPFGGAGNGAAAWANVPDKARKLAVAAARQDASAQVLDTISPIPLGPKHTVTDVVNVPAVRQDINTWLDARPITEVVFDEDLHVRLTLSVPGDELLDALRASAEKNNAASGIDPAAWSAARDEFAARVTPAVARGDARAGGNGGVQRAVIQIPAAPPAWAQQQIDAVGTASGTEQLKTARAAELDAIKKLRGQLEGLQLVPGVTIGEAARQDKAIAQAVDRGVRQARRTKTEFPAGGARVTMSLDLADAWDEIQAVR